jgi:hypothetical protein
MPSLEECQKQIAAQLTALPPEIQSSVLILMAQCYRAGHEAAQREIAEASKLLITTKIH